MAYGGCGDSGNGHGARLEWLGGERPGRGIKGPAAGVSREATVMWMDDRLIKLRLFDVFSCLEASPAAASPTQQ